jgi:hypothetical protein
MLICGLCSLGCGGDTSKEKKDKKGGPTTTDKMPKPPMGDKDAGKPPKDDKDKDEDKPSNDKNRPSPDKKDKEKDKVKDKNGVP